MDQPISSLSLSSEGLWNLSDEEFLARLEWERSSSVPAAVRRAGREGNVAEFTRGLQSRLKALVRSGRKHAGEHAVCSAGSALWSQQAFEATPRSHALAQIRTLFDQSSQPQTSSRDKARRSNSTRKSSSRLATNGSSPRQGGWMPRLSQWLDDVNPNDPLSLIERLLLGELLRDTGGELPRSECFRLWRILLTATLDPDSRAGAGSEEKAVGADTAPPKSPQVAETQVAPDHDLLLNGELPWQAGLLFSELAAARTWREEGQRYLRAALLDQTDDNGYPRAGLLERLAFWMSPLVRARAWAAFCGQSLWNQEAEKRFRLLVQSATAMCRPDGRLALSNGFVASAVDLLSSASHLAGMTKTAPALEYLRVLQNGSASGASRIGRAPHRGGLRSGRRKSRRIAGKKLTKFPGAQSDWAQLACLRSGWSVDDDALVVAHHESMPRLELSALGQPLLSGPWEVAVALDGTPLTFHGEWTCVCWFSDADADYIELKTEHPSGVKVERQILLAREDHFALFAEIVSGPAGARIECASRLPLVSGAAVLPDGPTRECRVKAKKVAARAFAPVLPSERVRGTADHFGPTEEILELRQAALGGLYAPIVIDWNPRRARAYADWRKLTVTEDGRVLSSGEACGCRLRIGEAHWFFYRSLKQSVMGRAVLGHHTFNETVIGHFDDSGNVEPILLVEYPSETLATT